MPFTELEEGEVGEDEAVCAVASEVGCGCYEIKLAAGGRANLIATEPCCILVDDDLLKQVNCTASVNIATALNFSFAMPGQRIATVKSAPFAVSQSDLAGLVNMLKDRGPIMQARPVPAAPRWAFCTPIRCMVINARPDVVDPIMRQRLERFNISHPLVLTCVEEESAVTRGLQQLLRSKPSVVLIASTTAPAGPEDVIGRALAGSGGQMERFLAPVEPGNLMILSYREDIPIVSAPGCFRSAKANVVDLILPPLLARYQGVSTQEIACLGYAAGCWAEFGSLPLEVNWLHRYRSPLPVRPFLPSSASLRRSCASVSPSALNSNDSTLPLMTVFNNATVSPVRFGSASMRSPSLFTRMDPGERIVPVTFAFSTNVKTQKTAPLNFASQVPAKRAVRSWLGASPDVAKSTSAKQISFSMPFCRA